MGGQSAAQRLLTGKFLLMYPEKRGRGKGVKIEKKRRKIVKWKWKVEIGNGRRMEGVKVVRTFFFFFFFLLFTFENDENLSWVYQNGNFLPGKNISRREKNQEK